MCFNSYTSQTLIVCLQFPVCLTNNITYMQKQLIWKKQNLTCLQSLHYLDNCMPYVICCQNMLGKCLRYSFNVQSSEFKIQLELFMNFLYNTCTYCVTECIENCINIMDTWCNPELAVGFTKITAHTGSTSNSFYTLCSFILVHTNLS